MWWCVLPIGHFQIRSDQISPSVVSNSLRPHESQHARPPCPSPTPGVHWDSCPSSPWCHPAISSSVVPFSCPQSLPASGSFPMSQLFTWGGQSIGVSASASVPPVNTQDWSPGQIMVGKHEINFIIQIYSLYFSLCPSLFLFLFHYSPLQGIEYSSLCYTVGPCCFSVLYIVVCIC